MANCVCRQCGRIMDCTSEVLCDVCDYNHTSPGEHPTGAQGEIGDMDNSQDQYIANEIEGYSTNPQFKAESLALAVAEEVALMLRARRISQSQLAEAMGVSRSRISQLLTAPPNMTFLTLARLGIALGVELGELLRLPGPCVVCGKGADGGAMPPPKRT